MADEQVKVEEGPKRARARLIEMAKLVIRAANHSL